jgi:putative intracellular protease/amidase
MLVNKKMIPSRKNILRRVGYAEKRQDWSGSETRKIFTLHCCQYWDDPCAHRLIKEALKKGKVLGAISIAPITLGNAKVLIGKKATVWPTLGNRLKWAGAIYTGEPVEIDGKIVTADRPDSAEEFAKAILSVILLK